MKGKRHSHEQIRPQAPGSGRDVGGIPELEMEGGEADHQCLLPDLVGPVATLRGHGGV